MATVPSVSRGRGAPLRARSSEPGQGPEWATETARLQLAIQATREEQRLWHENQDGVLRHVLYRFDAFEAELRLVALGLEECKTVQQLNRQELDALAEVQSSCQTRLTQVEVQRVPPQSPGQKGGGDEAAGCGDAAEGEASGVASSPHDAKAVEGCTVPFTGPVERESPGLSRNEVEGLVARSTERLYSRLDDTIEGLRRDIQSDWTRQREDMVAKQEEALRELISKVEKVAVSTALPRTPILTTTAATARISPCAEIQKMLLQDVDKPRSAESLPKTLAQSLQGQSRTHLLASTADGESIAMQVKVLAPPPPWQSAHARGEPPRIRTSPSISSRSVEAPVLRTPLLRAASPACAPLGAPLPMPQRSPLTAWGAASFQAPSRLPTPKPSSPAPPLARHTTALHPAVPTIGVAAPRTYLVAPPPLAQSPAPTPRGTTFGGPPPQLQVRGSIGLRGSTAGLWAAVGAQSPLQSPRDRSLGGSCAGAPTHGSRPSLGATAPPRPMTPMTAVPGSMHATQLSL